MARLGRERRTQSTIDNRQSTRNQRSKIIHSKIEDCRFEDSIMLHLPVLRWGEPYTSMEVDEVVHFSTGEPIARVSRANGGLIQRDARKAQRARDALREIPIDDLIARAG